MSVMTAGEIGAKRIEIEQEIHRLEREALDKKAELKELQKNCPHPDLGYGWAATWKVGVSSCSDCGFSWDSSKD